MNSKVILPETVKYVAVAVACSNDGIDPPRVKNETENSIEGDLSPEG